MSEIDLERPFPDWSWDPYQHRWRRPQTRLGSSIFNSEWNEKNKKWISECIIHDNRLFRAFQVWKVEEKNDNSTFNTACSTNEYMIKTMQEITHGLTAVNELVSSNIYGKVEFPLISKHQVIIDLSPLAVITYSETIDDTLVESVYKTHPQCTIKTIHELFRLIIEWAYSYTHLENTEPMAEISHRILQILQMPKDVRDDLLEIRPQPVARYLLGDTDALIEYDADTEMPESFRLWISEIYYEYKQRLPGFPVNINQSYEHLSYPM